MNVIIPYYNIIITSSHCSPGLCRQSFIIPILLIFLGVYLPSRTSEELMPPLPLVPDTFLGREGDVLQIKKYLNSSAIQVVHIVGPHAFGKKLLAIKVSHEMQREEADVVFVDVDGQSTFGGISKEVMKVLDVSFHSNDSKESLKKWVSSRTSLTILVLVKYDDWLEANNGNIRELKNLQNKSQVVKYILTSRYRVFDIKYFKQHELGNLSDHAAHELLGKLTTHSTVNLTQEDKVEIANLTGNHPLALKIVSGIFNLPKPPQPEVLIEDLGTELIEILNDRELNTEEMIHVCVRVAIHYFPNLQILAQNLSHYPGSFDEQSALEIVFDFSPEETSRPSERKSDCVSKLRALHQLSVVEYHRQTKRYVFFHFLIRDCFLYEDRYSENILFPTRFQLHYSQRLLDVSHSAEDNRAKSLNDDKHNFQHMFQLFSTSNCTFYYTTTLRAMHKTFEAIMYDPLQLKLETDVRNLTKCMMWFFDHCLNTSCSDTVNTASFYVMYINITVAVSTQEEDGHAACEVLLLRAETFEQAKDLLAQDESYRNFTSRRDKCLMKFHPKYDNISITTPSPDQVGSVLTIFRIFLCLVHADLPSVFT